MDSKAIYCCKLNNNDQISIEYILYWFYFDYFHVKYDSFAFFYQFTGKYHKSPFIVSLIPIVGGRNLFSFFITLFMFGFLFLLAVVILFVLIKMLVKNKGYLHLDYSYFIRTPLYNHYTISRPFLFSIFD